MSSTSTSRKGFSSGMLIGIGIGVAVWAWMEAQSFRREGALWPQFLAVVVIVSGLTILVSGRHQKALSGDEEGLRPRSGDATGQAARPTIKEDPERMNRSAEMVGAAVLAYIILARGLGFILATPMFIGGFMMYRGYAKRPLLLASIVAGATAIIYVLFFSVVGTPLHRAAWLSYRMPF